MEDFKKNITDFQKRELISQNQENLKYLSANNNNLEMHPVRIQKFKRIFFSP